MQAAIQENQVRVTGKKIDDLQEVIQMLRGASMPIPLAVHQYPALIIADNAKIGLIVRNKP